MKKKSMSLDFSVIIPVLVIGLFLIGFLFAPNNPMESNLMTRFQKPSSMYPFGTDQLGRCIFSRILYGGFTTLGIVLGGSMIQYTGFFCLFWTNLLTS